MLGQLPLVTLLLSVLAVGGFVEGFVLFSKTSAYPTSTLAYSQGVDAEIGKVKSLQETGYSHSTIKLIKEALNEQRRRQNASNTACCGS